MIESFPCVLYGARFLSSFYANVDKTNYKIDEYYLIDEFDDYAIYHLSTDEHHTYKISSDLKVIETFYRLEDHLEELAVSKMEEMYYGQAEWKFLYNEADPLESFGDQVYGEMFGYIMYPNIVFNNRFDAISFVKCKLIEEFIKINESNSRTITMYTEDTRRASESFKKVVEDSFTIENPVIGTKFYKYTSGVGVLSYELIEIIEAVGITMYKLICNSCNHSAPCEVIVSKVMKDSYSLVQVCDENNEHKHFHISETFFHTNKKSSYQEYLDKIKDYNDKVLNHFKEKKHLYELVINLK